MKACAATTSGDSVAVDLGTAIRQGVRRGIARLRYRPGYRSALAATALNAVAAGLPVIPGAWWSAAEQRFVCDLSGCRRTGPHPAVRNDSTIGLPGLGEALASRAIRQADAVPARWHRQPYAVLVPTGDSCDVVDVPAGLGRALAERLEARSSLGPVIAAGSRWFFLTASGGSLAALGGDVLVHGPGSWIMLPPSLGPGGRPAAWLAPPAGADWALPERDAVILGLTSPVPLPRRPGRQASPSPV